MALVERVDVGVVIGLGENGAEGALHVAFLLASRGFPRFSGLPLGKVGGLDGLQQRGEDHRRDDDDGYRRVQFLRAGVDDEDGAEGKEERKA